MAEQKKMGVSMDVSYVARLARLSLTDEERRTFQPQLDQVVGYVRQIGELDLSGVEPTSHVRPLSNVFRDDIEVPGLDHETVMRNAPETVQDQFSVPRIVE